LSNMLLLNPDPLGFRSSGWISCCFEQINMWLHLNLHCFLHCLGNTLPKLFHVFTTFILLLKLSVPFLPSWNYRTLKIIYYYLQFCNLFFEWELDLFYLIHSLQRQQLWVLQLMLNECLLNKWNH
jgi:hypothetical protein